jgi:hypothetical protein
MKLTPAETPMNQEPFRDCPRFDTCSVNACPMASNYTTSVTHPMDKESKCPMEKPVRIRISANYPGVLPMQGLTRAEWAGKQAYERKPLAVKQALIEKGKEALRQHRANL